MRLAVVVGNAAKTKRLKQSEGSVALIPGFRRMVIGIGAALALICTGLHSGVAQPAKEAGTETAPQQSGEPKKNQGSGERQDQTGAKTQDAADVEQGAGKSAKSEEPSPGKDLDKEKKPAASESQQGASPKAKSDETGSQQEGKDEKKDESAEKPAVQLTLQEQSEVWANLVGGGKRGTSYNGLTSAIVDVDLEKAVGWKRARFYASGFDIHGHGPSRALVGNDQLVSNIEATPSLKLYDLWLEQRFPGRVSVRLGQEGANDEMMTSAYGALYLNSSFGFPGLPAADLPSGGPNYPLATPFARLRWRASDQISVVGAIYNGDPAPPGPGDPQIRDRNGTAFRVNGNAYSFGELRYTENPDAPDTLQTNYKLGVWYHSGRFADRRFDLGGGLLADPAGSGIPRQHRGDIAAYGIVDQILWRREGSKDRGIGVFLQFQTAPSDRNLADLFVEGGVNWSGPFSDRPKDVAGIAFAYLGISDAAQRFSRDLVAFGRASSAFASNETVIEATYKAVITDQITLQPDAQIVLNPNAGVPGSFGPRRLANAFIIGLRTTVKLQGP